MDEQLEGGVLRVGLVTEDRKKFLSPGLISPELFSTPFRNQPRLSIETQAVALLGEKGIVSTSLHSLSPRSDTPDKGYLLREVRPHDTDSLGLAIFTSREIFEFIADYPPDDIRGHFLRQIIRHMR